MGDFGVDSVGLACYHIKNGIQYTVSQIWRFCMKEKLELAAVLPEVNLISDDEIRNKTVRIWQELYAMSKWENVMALPVSLTKTDYPHVVHNRAIVQMAIAVAQVAESNHHVTINMDYLISAALLQDASKLIEYEPDAEKVAVKSEIGKCFTHSFYAAHLAENEGLPREISQCILSHSPGAPAFPDTVIGKILFYVDQIDMALLGDKRWKKSIFINR